MAINKIKFLQLKNTIHNTLIQFSVPQNITLMSTLPMLGKRKEIRPQLLNIAKIRVIYLIVFKLKRFENLHTLLHHKNSAISLQAK